MIEEIEIRCESGVKRYLGRALVRDIAEEIGDQFFTVLKIVMPSNDPRWEKVVSACRRYGEATEKRRKRTKGNWVTDWLQEMLKEYKKTAREKGWKLRGPSGYSTAFLRRKYTRRELWEAKVLQLLPFVSITLPRDPEEDKAIYDDSARCPLCRAGRIQKSDLAFDLSKAPKSKDIVLMYAEDEMIISDRLATILRENQITGFKLRPVRDSKIRRRKELPKWWQLIAASEVGRPAPLTRYGDDPFYPDVNLEEACPCGRTMGLNLLSELYISKRNWDGTDIAATTTYIGGGKGLGLPRRLTVISQSLYRLLKEQRIRGFRVEVVHLV